MSPTSSPETISIYDWLCCPECDSREIIRGPRTDSGTVKIECERCGTTGWVSL